MNFGTIWHGFSGKTFREVINRHFAEEKTGLKKKEHSSLNAPSGINTTKNLH